MKFLKYFNENQKVSIFDPNWVKLIPIKLTIITENGEFTLERNNEITDGEEHPVNVSNLMNCLQISYSQNTVKHEEGDVTFDGEPDYLGIDITLVKDNKGDSANPDSLRLNIDLTYGDQMQYSFTIDKPNKVNVHHYTGKHSLYDPETYWGFTDESLEELVTFFNRFGFQTTPDDYKFMDKDPDSFEYEKSMPKGQTLNDMTGNLKPDVVDLRGGDKILRYKDFKKKS